MIISGEGEGRRRRRRQGGACREGRGRQAQAHRPRGNADTTFYVCYIPSTTLHQTLHKFIEPFLLSHTHFFHQYKQYHTIHFFHKVYITQLYITQYISFTKFISHNTFSSPSPSPQAPGGGVFREGPGQLNGGMSRAALRAFLL